MPCFHRRKAWRTKSGSVTFRSPAGAAEMLLIPCGNCIGCRQATARDWMVRCQLEMSKHKLVCWATLTYSDENLPPTLSKRHLSGFVKRLRTRIALQLDRNGNPRRFRHFGCGEYGEKRGRAHYHIILFGLGPKDKKDIEAAWGLGHVYVDQMGPAVIPYVAGYSAKKIGDRRKTWVAPGRFERLDPGTGEVTEGVFRNVIYQGPFLLMSRNPGIAGDARLYSSSWRKTAIWDGAEVRVPRYLHDSYKAKASPEALAKLQQEKDAFLASIPLDSKSRERAAEAIAKAKYKLKLSQRGKL